MSVTPSTPARGLTTVALGIALIVISRALDEWLGGLLLGAGLALTPLGVALISSDLRSARSSTKQWGWLPSRDRDDVRDDRTEER